MPLSQKQIQSINEANKRFCIWVGAVRSGKTFASILKLIDLIKNGPLGDGMIIGVNRDTIQRNVLLELYKFLGWPPPGTKITETKMYGRNIYFVGAHDEGSVRRIQGSTLAFAYVDEATCIPVPFWRMLTSRLSIKGAQLLATCNPEGPFHWLKKEYIDRADEIDLISWHFLMDDNPSLGKSYVESMKKEFTGMWYKRYILGEWAVSHGLIYDTFDEMNTYEQPRHNATSYIVGIDYGTSNATAAVLCAINPRLWPQIHVEAEYYYDSQKKGRQKTDDELAQDIKEFIAYRNVSAIYVDPSAASLKLELRNRNLPVLDAKNDILPGIKIVSKFIANKNLVVHKSCRTLTEVLQTYSWDPKAADRGEDAPLKKREHICVVGDTEILMNGEYCQIRYLIGHNLAMFNYNPKNGCIEWDCMLQAKKTKKSATVYELILEDGKKLVATPDHKIYTTKGAIELQKLGIGNEVLVCHDNQVYTSGISCIKKSKRKRDVYCIGTDRHGTMVANGMIVSNCDALRYACYTAFPTGEFNSPDENLSIDQIRRQVYGNQMSDPFASYAEYR